VNGFQFKMSTESEFESLKIIIDNIGKRVNF